MVHCIILVGKTQKVVLFHGVLFMEILPEAQPHPVSGACFTFNRLALIPEA